MSAKNPVQEHSEPLQVLQLFLKQKVEFSFIQLQLSETKLLSAFSQGVALQQDTAFLLQLSKVELPLEEKYSKPREIQHVFFVIQPYGCFQQ